MTTEEMKQELMTYGYTEDNLNMRKPELKKLIEEIKETEKVLDDVVVNQDSTIEIPDIAPILITETIPEQYSLEWTDYVMSQFDPKKELENGMPRVDGLRRVAHKLLGNFSIDTVVLQVPDTSNAGRATVIVKLQFDKGYLYSGAADVYGGNTKSTFACHPVATAETRAEGRALRKALRLVKVVTAEELESADKDEANGITDNRVPSEMLNSLHLMAHRLGIDLFKLAIKANFDLETVETMTMAQGQELNLMLGQFGRKEKDIPNEIRK